eukprot:8639848-Lingulodinium_polyedra.AAC.1
MSINQGVEAEAVDRPQVRGRAPAALQPGGHQLAAHAGDVRGGRAHCRGGASPAALAGGHLLSSHAHAEGRYEPDLRFEHEARLAGRAAHSAVFGV